MSSILVSKPSELNIDWAQRVVNQHYSNIVVSDVNIVSVDIGTTTRIRVKTKHNAPDIFPEQWFVKLPSTTWRAKIITALPRLLHTEVRFYNEINGSASIITPRSLGAQSKFGSGATLVLADMTDIDFILGEPSDVLTFAQAASVVEQMANFHAHFWNNIHLDHTYRWLDGPVRRLEDFLGTALAVPLMKRGLRKAGGFVPAKLHSQAVHYARNRKKAMRFLNSAPQTLVHHDCHPGNLFWHKSKPGFLDWQLVRFGEGISDIAYFLSTSLDPRVRREHEVDLITLYAQNLQANGVRDVDVKILLERYRAHLIYSFEAMILTLGIGGMMSLESNYELISRTVASVLDHDSFARIPI